MIKTYSCSHQAWLGVGVAAVMDVLQPRLVSLFYYDSIS